jgi:hypothetical protein
VIGGFSFLGANGRTPTNLVEVAWWQVGHFPATTSCLWLITSLYDGGGPN